MKVLFALCAQNVSIDRATNRVSLFNVLDHIPAVNTPLVFPELSFVSIIERTSDEPANLRAAFNVSLNDSVISALELPVPFARDGPLARVIVNFQGLPIKEPGLLTFELKLSPETTAAAYVRIVAVVKRPVPPAPPAAPAAPAK